jgi:hypothetical protein
MFSKQYGLIALRKKYLMCFKLPSPAGESQLHKMSYVIIPGMLQISTKFMM